MLKQRVLTALLLAPLVVWGIFQLPSMWFGALLAIFVTVGAWEWARLAGFSSRAARWLFAGFVFLLLALVGYFIDYEHWQALIFVSALWWVYAVYAVVRYQGGLDGKRSPHRLVVGLILLIPAWYALVGLHRSEHGALAVLFLMLLIWGADSGAYFAGRAFGKRKLAPKVSPGKSWEGVAGAMALTFVLAVVGGLQIWHLQGAHLGVFIVICITTVAFSIVGDLYESLAKRRVGVKDSGQLLPGHGGVLDRIDSLTAAAPMFLLGLNWLPA